MKFLWVTMMVKDLDKTQRFYEDIVGLKLRATYQAGDREISFLCDEEGETQVELISGGNDADIAIGTDVSLGFEVDSVEDMYALAVEKGLNIATDIIAPSPQVKFFYVYDPNGAKVQFVEQVG